jgi:hypothetical protein
MRNPPIPTEGEGVLANTVCWESSMKNTDEEREAKCEKKEERGRI